MKVVSTEALTKLIQLIKSSFISVDDTEQTSEIETETPSEVTLATVATTGDYDDLINTPTVYHPDLLSFQWSDHLLNNVSWLRADTFSWQDGTVYAAAYEHLTDDITGITPTTETVGSNTITVYTATDGHKIVLADQAQTVQDIYNETGVAWYFILDTTNQRFKLPRTKFGFTGLRDTVGKYVEAGLPNITGSTESGSYWHSSTTDDSTGPFYRDYKYGTNVSGSTGQNYSSTLNFDASRSSSIYGNSSTVQPTATQMYLYFYVGDYTQTAIEQTAGLNAELFNGKMDRDMSNMNASQTAKETIIGWCMPDYSAGVSVSTSQGNTYTVPSDGVIKAKINWSGSTVLDIRENNSSGQQLIYIWQQNQNSSTCYMPVSKDMVLYFTERNGADVQFYPYKGVQNA